MSVQDIIPYRLPKIEGKRLIDPHVVIVGAGASVAACKIDKNGNQVPLLKNIHVILNLEDELKKYNFSAEEMMDFELLFSNIYDKPEFAALQRKLEYEVCEYFEKLTIPDEPTYYDYLILSLTEKDTIISFNWDPFLIQAYRRNLVVGNLPELIFPHGNAGVGICYNCKAKWYAGCYCTECGHKFEKMPLLFPIGKKNYNKTLVIQNEWNIAKRRLSNAVGITVYGYGAPATDYEAVELMKSAYTESNVQDIAPFTIINLPAAESDQRKKWSEFFTSKMVSYCNSIEDSLLWRNPRVSLETLFDAILQQYPRGVDRSFSKFLSLEELQKFAGSITEFDMHI